MAISDAATVAGSAYATRRDIRRWPTPKFPDELPRTDFPLVADRAQILTAAEARPTMAAQAERIRTWLDESLAPTKVLVGLVANTAWLGGDEA
ncbi:hypothetical protein [Nocardia sp. NPDC050710]|uniref:hypothetical protein n=1 Tax=Nocardia sp. NPDC050710 TaxID=3157220 RepID=UPI0033F66B8D